MRRRALAELLRRRCRQSFYFFSRTGWSWVPGAVQWPTWVWPMTLMALCGEQVARGRCDIIIGNAPPGAGKSSLLARLLWSWAMLDVPSTRCAGLVHTIDTLGFELQNDRREVMTHPQYQRLIPRDRNGRPVWLIDPKNNNKSKLQVIPNPECHPSDRVRAGGWHMLAAPTPSGEGAGLTTGFHPHYHQVDDVLKAKAEHTSALDACKAWLTGPMSTRFPSNQPERLIAFTQVVDALDHTQALLDFYPQARSIVLPMCYDPERAAPDPVDLGEPPPLLQAAFDGNRTLIGMRDEHKRAGISIEGGRVRWRDPRTRDGELLMPELVGPDRVKAKQRSKIVWSLQYQQDRSGGKSNRLFEPDDWKLWTKVPSGTPDEIVVSVDSQEGDPNTAKEHDATVMYVVARFGSRAYLLEEVRANLGTTDAVRVLFTLFHRWSGSSRRPCARIERAKSGPSIVNNLEGILTGLELVKPQGNTRWRIEQCRPVIEAGCVLLPAPNAERPHMLAAGESWPSAVIDRSSSTLPRTLRSGQQEIVTLRPARVWVPEAIEELCTPGRPDDRQDGVAYAVMPWVGIIHKPEAPRRAWRPPQMKTSLAAQFGIR